MGYFSRSLELAKRSWNVLRKDQELLLLPSLGVLAQFAIGGILWGLIYLIDFDPSVGWKGLEISSPSIALIILGAILGAIVIYFFAGALVHGAHERLTGGDPTVRSSLAGARSRLSKIVSWAILTIIVGTIINVIESAIRDRAGFLGNIIGSILGLAWKVLTFLVMPVVIVEGLGGFKAVKRSKDLLKSTWGENLIAQAGLAIVRLLAVLPGILLGFLLGFTGFALPGIVLGIVFGLAGFVFAAALGGIYQTALYQYTTTGQVPEDFAGSGMETTFTHRSQRSRRGMH